MASDSREPTPVADHRPLVRMTGISKRFGRVPVLRDVQFEVRSGEVHVLAGENGAGKSTLIKILAGIHTEFEGRIEYDGKEARPKTPLEANALGVAVIHQELSLIGPMSVADNIFLGRTPTKAGMVLDSLQEREALRWVRQLGLDIDVRQPVERFPIALQQLMEIAKALSQKATVIVMDEPTSALNKPEVETLFTQIQSLKGRGCGIVYISHKMEEIERVADRITVLRDGGWVGTAPARELPRSEFVRWMVGRELGDQFPSRNAHSDKDRLRLAAFSVFPDGFSAKPAVRNVSLTVKAGEVLGIGGLQGSGASELLLGLFGAYGSVTRGRAEVDGVRVSFSAPRQAIDSGVALLTNDRKATGLILSLSVTANATLAGLKQVSRHGWLRSTREKAAAVASLEPMRLRAASLDMEVGVLSGGNQQKVALAKWLQTQPRLLLLDEPTRGIDIAAKREVYQLINEWTAEGISILLITSEMPELLGLSDRIVVLHRGSVTAEFSRAEATPERILAAAMGTNQPSLPA